MTMKSLPAMLLGTAAALMLSFGAAFANSDGGLSTTTGYVYPNYWGQAPALQQNANATVPHHADINTTDRSGEISLYPPNPWG
jgi:hypothetical protein